MLAYTQPGDLVVVASGAGIAGPTIEGLQRRCAGLTAALASSARAALVLITPTWASSLAMARVADQFRKAARVLRPGGLVVAVTRAGWRVDRGGVGCRPSEVVRAAQRAGFGYLQHNVAVHAPIGDEGLLPCPPRRPPLRADACAPSTHRVVHSDVLVFTAPVSTDG